MLCVFGFVILDEIICHRAKQFPKIQSDVSKFRYSTNKRTLKYSLKNKIDLVWQTYNVAVNYTTASGKHVKMADAQHGRWYMLNSENLWFKVPVMSVCVRKHFVQFLLLCMLASLCWPLPSTVVLKIAIIGSALGVFSGVFLFTAFLCLNHRIDFFFLWPVHFAVWRAVI